MENEGNITIPLSRYKEIMRIEEALTQGLSAKVRPVRTRFFSKDEYLNMITKEKEEIESALIELMDERDSLKEDVDSQIKSKSIFELLKIKFS